MLYTAGTYAWQSLGAYSDVWKRELPGVWTNMNVTRAFDPRAGHALVYFKGAVYSIGGTQDGGGSLNPASTGPAQIWKTTDLGATWTQLRPNLPYNGNWGAWVQPATSTSEEALVLITSYGNSFVALRTVDANLTIWNTTWTSVNTTFSPLDQGRWVPYYNQMVYLHGFFYDSAGYNNGNCSGSTCYSVPYSSLFLDINFTGTDNGCVTTTVPVPSSSSSSSTGGGGSVTFAPAPTGPSNNAASSSGTSAPGNSATQNQVSELIIMFSILLAIINIRTAY